MTEPESDDDSLEQRIPIGSTLEESGAGALDDAEAAMAPVVAGLRGIEPDRGRFD